MGDPGPSTKQQRALIASVDRRSLSASADRSGVLNVASFAYAFRLAIGYLAEKVRSDVKETKIKSRHVNDAVGITFWISADARQVRSSVRVYKKEARSKRVCHPVWWSLNSPDPLKPRLNLLLDD